MPNQDAVGSKITGMPHNGPVLVTAVADGHGGAPHYRSDRGAQLAVSEGLAAAADWLAAMPPGPAAAKADAASALVPDIVARWDAAVAADIAAHPLTETETEHSAGASPLSSIAYGTTLLLSIISAGCAVLVQIGDGDILAVRPDGRCLRPVPEDSNLDGRRTTSLCQPGAAASFRVGVVDLVSCPLFAVLVATDGFGNSQAAERWQPRVAADLVGLGLEHGLDWLGGAVPSWAEQCASSEGSADDCTVALAVNSAAKLGRPDVRPDQDWSAAKTLVKRTLGLPERGVTVPAAQVDGKPAAAQPPGRGFRRTKAGRELRYWWMMAAGIVLVVIVVLVFAFLPHRPGPVHHHGRTPVHGPSTGPTRGTSAGPASPKSTATARPSPSPAPNKRVGP